MYSKDARQKSVGIFYKHDPHREKQAAQRSYAIVLTRKKPHGTTHALNEVYRVTRQSKVAAMISKKNALRASLVLSAMLLSDIAIAAITCSTTCTQWDFRGSTQSIPNGTQYTANGQAITISAWADSTTTPKNVYATSATRYSGGLGICAPTANDPNCTSPNHAIDNNPTGTTEMILVTAVGNNMELELDGIGIGWASTDSDMTVARYLGGTGCTFNGTLSGTWDSILNSGCWSAQNLVNVAGSTPTVSGTSYDPTLTSGSTAGGRQLAQQSSKYWLVGAYNSYAGGTLSTGNDYVKLALLTGIVKQSGGGSSGSGNGVPEPTTLLLLGSGILFLMKKYRARALC